MKEYSSVCGVSSGYEAPELRVVSVVCGGFLSTSDPKLFGSLGDGSSFGVYGGESGLGYGGLSGGLSGMSFDVGDEVGYGGLSGGLSEMSFDIESGVLGGLSADGGSSPAEGFSVAGGDSGLQW